MKLGNWNDTPPLSDKEFAEVKKQVDEYFKKQSLKGRHALAQESFKNSHIARVSSKKQQSAKKQDG